MPRGPREAGELGCSSSTLPPGLLSAKAGLWAGSGPHERFVCNPCVGQLIPNSRGN